MKTYGSHSYARPDDRPSPTRQEQFDEAIDEAISWELRRNGLKAQPWLTLASRWAKTNEDFRALERIGKRIDQITPDRERRAYHAGRLKIPLESASVRRDEPRFNARRVNRYMRMLKRIDEGRAERWQATQLFREMTGPDMNEIMRRRRLQLQK